MRVLLVGAPSDRARMRAAFDEGPLEVVAEFPSLAAAQAARVEADAIVLATRPPADAAPADWQETLTAREIEVVELLAEGLPNKSIASRLGISDQTVKFHVSVIYGKLGAVNRTDAVRRAARRGLITL